MFLSRRQDAAARSNPVKPDYPTKRPLTQQDDDDATAATTGLWESSPSLGFGDSFATVPSDSLKSLPRYDEHDDQDDESDDEYIIPLNDQEGAVRISRPTKIRGESPDPVRRRELLLDNYMQGGRRRSSALSTNFEEDSDIEDDDDASESSYQEYENQLFEQFKAFQLQESSRSE